MVRSNSSLGGNSDFHKLWAAHTVSMFGSLLSRMALPFTAVLCLHASPLNMGLLVAAEIAPGFILALYAGVWLDTIRRRGVMIVSDAARALLLISVPVLAWSGLLQLSHLYIVALVTGALTVVFDVASPSYLPSLVSNEQLLEANSKLAVSASVAEVASFGLSGVLIEWLTAPGVILLDASTYFLSAVFLLLIGKREIRPVPDTSNSTALRAIGEGLRSLVYDPILRLVTGASVSAAFFSAIIGALWVLYVSQELRVLPVWIGIIAACGGLSATVGGALIPHLNRHYHMGVVLPIAMGCTALGMSFLPLARGPMVLIIAFVIMQQLVSDAAFTVVHVYEVTLRQATVPERLLGRVNASVRFANLGATTAGSVVGGALGNVLGLRATLAIAAAGLLGSAAWFLPKRIRHVTSKLVAEMTSEPNLLAPSVTPGM